MIRVALETIKPFEMRDLVLFMYDVEHGHNCDLTVV